MSFVWEAVRFVLLIKILQVFFNPLQSLEYDFFFLWMMSYGFLAMMGLGLSFFRPEKYALLGRTVGAVKILQALAGVGFLLYEFGVLPVLLGFLDSGILGLVPATILRALIPSALVMTALDLISGIFLVVYRPKQSEKTVSVRITDVEEE